MTEQGETQTAEKEPVVPRPPPSEEEKEEKRPFNLAELMRSRRKGEGPGFWETLAYMDYQDRKEERAWRREERERATKNTPQTSASPDVEALKKEVGDLKDTVSDLLETIRSQQQEKAQKEFVDGVVKSTTDKIMPELQAVKQKLEEYDQRLAKGEPPEFSLEELKESLVDAIDRLGEKAGAGGKTLTDVVGDVDKLLGVVESIEKRIRKGEGGEVDYKTMAVSTVGEIGKELITAYKEIETSKSGGLGSAEVPPAETPASTMQTIIKRQVQNYLTQRMTAGAVTFNVAEAAKELGLTPGQIVWAYKELMKEGFFQVKVSSKGKKVRQTETIGETQIPTPTETTEEEQVFNPPAET